MKRPRKWVLLGILVLVAGAILFWVDILRRADNAIAVQERQIVEDFGEMRRRPNLKEVLLRRPLTHETLHELGERGGLVDVPAGHWLSFGHDDETRQAIIDIGDDWLRMPEPELQWTPEMILTCLIANQEVLREGGRRAWNVLRNNRDELLAAWRQLLISKPPSAAQLHPFLDGLALLEATEPHLEETYRIDRLQAGLDIVRVLRRRVDPTHLFNRGPCWRELFSWRILVAKSLQQLRLDPMGDGDGHLSLPYGGGGSRPRPTVWPEDPWALARTATAIALFHAEKGTFPDVLEELVPEYLPEVPRRADGKAILLEDYFLDRPPGSAVPWDQWPLIRH